MMKKQKKNFIDMVKSIISYALIIISTPFLFMSIFDFIKTNNGVNIFIFIVLLFPFIFSIRYLRKSGRCISFMRKTLDALEMESARKMTISDVNAQIDRANKLADIANKTTDKEEFFNSINEIKTILMELSKYEGKLPFKGAPSADLRKLEQAERCQIELLEKRIEESQNKKIKNESFEQPDKKRTSNPIKDKPAEVRNKPKIVKRGLFGTAIHDVTQYAVMCNAYLDHQEEMEQYGIKAEEEAHKDDTDKGHEPVQAQYEYVLFSESIDTDAIIGFRSDYMRSDYTIEPIFYESHQYIYNVWKLSTDLEKTINPKRFFESIEEIEKKLEEISKYSYPKFNPEKEKEYYYLKKNEVLVEFLVRSFTKEYENAIELKTAQGKINRIGNWFSTVYCYKGIFTPNGEEIFERLVVLIYN